MFSILSKSMKGKGADTGGFGTGFRVPLPRTPFADGKLGCLQCYVACCLDKFMETARECRSVLWFGHGCLSDRIHEHYYALGMDALVTVCSWNMNVIMVWPWMF